MFRGLNLSTRQRDQDPVEMSWRIGVTDIEDCPRDIIKPGRGATKITECGIAACISHPHVVQRVFCTIPTPLESNIAISFNASFAITGDRKSIPFESLTARSYSCRMEHLAAHQLHTRFLLAILERPCTETRSRLF